MKTQRPPHRSGEHPRHPSGDRTPLTAMLEALQLRGDEHVLEVGCASHEAAHALASRTRDVISIAGSPDGARARAEHLASSGCHNVQVETGRFDAGFSAAAPYDVIVVSGAATELPPQLVDQLAPGGKLVIPLGDASGQVIELIERHDVGVISRAIGTCHLPLLAPAGATPSTYPWTG